MLPIIFFQLSHCQQIHWLPPTEVQPCSGLSSPCSPEKARSAAQALLHDGCNSNNSAPKQIIFPSEQRKHFPHIIYCHWSLLFPSKTRFEAQNKYCFRPQRIPKSEQVKLHSSFWGHSSAWNLSARNSRECPGEFSSLCPTSFFTTQLSASVCPSAQKQMDTNKMLLYSVRIWN